MEKKVKILIVEDEVISAMYLQVQLKMLDYEICKKVVTGEDAVKMAIIEKPDVILIDIRLAGRLDGIQTVKDILSYYNPIIIFMTGYQDEDLVEQAKKLTNAEILIKPFEINEINRIIQLSLKKIRK
jgi:Response regulator containing CheY-like receiver, AAA-type ATPase, and DNA-binding domains